MRFGSTRIQKEVIDRIASKLGISEREAQEVVELIANAVKPEVGKFVGRRSFLAGLAGVGTALAISPAMARTTITDEYVDIDGVKLALKDYADMFTSPAFASAVVEKPEYDPDHVYAWKPANNYKGWKLIAKGEAGVDDAEIIEEALSVADYVFLKPEVTFYGDIQLSGGKTIKSVLVSGKNAADEQSVTASTINLQGTVSANGSGWHKHISDLVIDGNDQAKDRIKFTGSFGDHRFCILKNLIIQNGNKGLYLQGFSRSTISNVRLVDNVDAIYLTDSAVSYTHLTLPTTPYV